MAKTDEKFDPFAVDDSNEIGDYSMRVLSSVFETDPEYNDGESLLLQWETEITGGEIEFDTRKVSFTCGAKFETPDGGKTAAHESGKDKGFNSQSRIGMLIKRAFYDPKSDLPAPTVAGDKDGEETESLELKDHFVSLGTSPMEARGWVGIEFAMRSETRDWGGEIGKRSFEMPWAVISLPGGEGEAEKEEEVKPKKAAKKTATKKKVTKKAVEVDWDIIKRATLEHAAAADDHAEFVVLGTGFIEEQGIAADADGFVEFFDWLGDEEEGGWSMYYEEDDD